MNGDSGHDRREDCPACGVSLIARPRSGRLLGIVAGVPAFVLLLFLGSPRLDWVALGVVAVPLFELALFLRIGGARLLLEDWRVCPDCGDFRISDAAARRLRRVESTVGRLRYYLLIPILFLLLLTVASAASARGAPESLALLPPLLYGFLAAELMMPRPRSPIGGHRASRILDENAAGAEPAS